MTNYIIKKTTARNVRSRRKSMRGGKSKRTRGTRGTRGKKGKKNNKWVTALSAANQELEKTGSYRDARRSLRKQALHNATQIFGAIGDTM
jgi:ribosomal protein L15